MYAVEIRILTPAPSEALWQAMCVLLDPRAPGGPVSSLSVEVHEARYEEAAKR